MACCAQCETMAGVDAGECDRIVTFTWPSDVDALKKRIGLAVDELDVSIKQCASFPAADRTAWTAFAATWRAFAANATGLFGSGGDWNVACGYAKTVDAWRAKVDGMNCNVVGPAPIQGPDTSVIKWAVVGVLGIAVAYVVHKVL